MGVILEGPDLVLPAASGGGGDTPPDPVSYDPITSGDWTRTSPSGGGTAAITGGKLVLTQPTTATGFGDGSRAMAMRSLAPDVDSDDYFEVIFRIASLTGGSSTTVLALLVSDAPGTGGREIRAHVGYTGSINAGYLTQGGGWHGQSISGSVAVDGTGWMRLRVFDDHAEWSSGSGASQPTSWTPRVMLSWANEINASWGTTAVPNDLAYWGFVLAQFSSAPGTNAVATIDNISIRRLVP